MKVAWSVIVGDARGKIGICAATKTRSGHMFRSCWPTRDPKTQAQRLLRASLTSYSKMWADPSMTGFRAAWVTLAGLHAENNVFGQPIYKTAINWFVRANITRQGIGEAPLTTAPPFAPVGDPGSITAIFTPGIPGTLEITATTPPGATEAVVIQATRGLSPGIATLSNQQVTIYTENPGTAGPWEIYAEYLARFGTPLSDKQLFFRVHYVDIPQGRAGLSAQTSLVW